MRRIAVLIGAALLVGAIVFAAADYSSARSRRNELLANARPPECNYLASSFARSECRLLEDWPRRRGVWFAAGALARVLLTGAVTYAAPDRRV